MSLGGRTTWAGPETWDAAQRAIADGLASALTEIDDAGGDPMLVIAVQPGEPDTAVALLGPAGLGMRRSEATADVDGTTVPAAILSDGDGGQVAVTVVPAEGWARLQITGADVGDTTIERRRVAPEVTLTSPTAGSSVSTGGALNVSWTSDAAEAAGFVEVSADGGTTWHPVAYVVGTSASVPADLLPVGGELLVRVQVADGAAVGTSAPVAVRVPPRNPDLLILGPTDGEVVPHGRVVELHGSVVGEIEDRELVWELDGTRVATGRRAVLTGLATGEHEITFRAVDRAQAGASMQVMIRVIDDADADGAADDWEVARGYDPLSYADGLRDGDGDGLLLGDEFRYGTDPSLHDTDGDGFADGIEVLAGTDPTDPESMPTSIHGWPDPLPTAVALASSDDAAGWRSMLTTRNLLIVALVIVILLDIALIIRRRRRRKYG
jgi:hypothetical protein